MVASEFGALIRGMSDRVLWLVVVIGTVTVVANTWRAAAMGSWTTLAVDVGVFAVVVFALLLRRRLPARTSFWLIVTLIFLEGLVRLATLGLVGSGAMILGAGCALVGIFYGMRPGLCAVGAAVTSYVILGIAHHVGWLSSPAASLTKETSLTSWLTNAGLLAGFAGSVVIAAHVVQQRLLRSLADLRRRSSELLARSTQLRNRSRALRSALRKLRTSERKYRLISDQVTDVVFVTKLDGLPEYVSPSARSLFGYSAAELRRLPTRQLMTPSSAEQARETLRHYFELAQRAPVDVPPAEYEYARKDGTTFWGELKTGFIRSEEGAITAIHGVIRDVSWRKEAELERERLAAELRQAEKMRAIGQLASGVAHDFNNQLTVIQGYAELLAGDRSKDPSTRQAAEHIAAAAQRSADLTQQLLAFGRRGATQAVNFDLNQTVREAVHLLSRSVDRRIRIQTQLASQPALVMGDPSQLCSALLNLGLNARDAMPEGGDVVFSTTVAEVDAAASAPGPAEQGRGWVELRVEDTGIGMDQEILLRAFEPFFTTKPVGSGTGMGLAAVYGTVTAHGGTVWAESQLGKGTSVHLRLPLAAATSAQPGEALTDQDAAPRALHVLLIDDELPVCNLAREVLEQHGLRVSAFTDATAAIEHVRAHAGELDLAVIDLTMPTMNGTQCLRALRQASPELPALFISGDSPSEEARELVQQGSCTFLAKPFRAADLVSAVRESAQRALPRALVKDVHATI